MLWSGFGRTTSGLLAAIWLFSVTFAVVAQAEGEPDYSRSGVYLGLGVGVAVDMTFEDALDDVYHDVGRNATVNDSPAIDAFVGYRLFPWLATELQLEYVIKGKTEIDGTEEFSHQLVFLTANVKVPVVRGRLQPFLLVGGGMFHARFDDSQGGSWSPSYTNFALRAGGGIDFYFTENVWLNLGVTYVVPFGDDPIYRNVAKDTDPPTPPDIRRVAELNDLDYISVSLGAQYRF
jgi:opacity protein-like surface antigen